MKNQITNRNWLSSTLSFCLMMAISFTSFAQHGGPGQGPSNGGSHNPGNPPTTSNPPQPPHHMGCEARFLQHRDSVANGIAFYNLPGSGAATYAWDFGDGSTGNTASPAHVYAASGTYYVCLTVTDTVGGGCSNTHCDSVRVFTPAPHCNAHFYSQRDSIANGIRFRSGSNAPGTTYAWDFGDGSTSTVQNPSNAYAAAGTYYVCLTVTNTNSAGTCTDTHCDSVRVFTPAPRCNAHFASRGDTTVANGVQFRGGNNSPGTTYAWDFGDGNTSNLQSPSNAYAAAGTYYVCLTVTNTNAGGTCTDTHCDSVNTAHPGNGGPGHPHHHLKTAGSTSRVGSTTSDVIVELYPNPMVSNSTVHVENTSGNAVFTVYQMTGQVVYSQVLVEGDNTISKENLSNGLYFYTVVDQGANIANGKLRVY